MTNRNQKTSFWIYGKCLPYQWKYLLEREILSDLKERKKIMKLFHWNITLKNCGEERESNVV